MTGKVVIVTGATRGIGLADGMRVMSVSPGANQGGFLIRPLITGFRRD